VIAPTPGNAEENGSNVSTPTCRERALARGVSSVVGEGERAEPAPAPAEEPAPRRRRRTLFIVAAVLALVIGGVLAWTLIPWRSTESTDDAFIDGHVSQVSARVMGRISRVLVNDNQAVAPGDLLVELDPADYQSRLDSARAALNVAEAAKDAAEKTVAQVQASATAGIEQAEADVQSASAQVERARAEQAAATAESQRASTELERYQGLQQQSAVAPQELIRAQAAAQVASANLEAARRSVTASESAVVAARARVASARAEQQRVAVVQAQAAQAAAAVEQARAALRQAGLDLSYTRIAAPFAGRVAQRTAEPGAVVQPGQALLAVVSDDLWVTANFKETQLKRMRPGQPATIKIDAYPGQRFDAHVDSIQPGAGAAFSLLPPENATGNYVKVVQRVPVKIVFDALPDPRQFPMGPGMSVVPKVRVRE
jgi:membrane fusion protein (multidrug efflux system)